MVSRDVAQAGEFAELFRAVYLTFHRRDGPRGQLPNASLAVLEHLAHAGPFTVGDAAAHLSRAQSVVSEIVSHLERQGMLERVSDPADRRRTLVWLTGAGQDTLRRQREVLSTDLLAGALSRMPPDQVSTLLGALCSLISAATGSPAAPGLPKEKIMTNELSCESCGMPIETGRYCGNCTDETGQLQPFEDRFERMTAWQARRSPDTPREEIERQTLEYMATMPAWRDHPRVASRAG